jgi:hypothetical protein
MPKVFLCYSSAYGHLLEPFRRLLQVLELDVDVFDEPDIQRPPASIVQSRLGAADAVVVLLGPAERTSAPASPTDAARSPNEECILALTLKKPTAIILHPGTRLPQLTENIQTPPVFDFWDAGSFLRSAPHVLKHLLDLRRQFELPPGNQPFVFTKSVVHNRIRKSSLFVQVYHEVIVRQPWYSFDHSLDTGLDQSEDAVIKLLSEEVEIDAPIGGELHRPEVIFEEIAEKEIRYVVKVKPGLSAGEKYGYQREFELQNWFPVEKSELEARAAKAGFSPQFRQDGRLYYGDVWDVLHEMDSVALVFHFPWKVKLAGYRALALTYGTRHVNQEETDRCNNRDTIWIDEDPQNGERTLTLSVRRPLINHSYVLLYELGE